MVLASLEIAKADTYQLTLDTYPIINLLLYFFFSSILRVKNRFFILKTFKMAMSGVELDAECKVVYDEVQSKKKHRYVTFMIADGKIKVDKVCYLFL